MQRGKGEMNNKLRKWMKGIGDPTYELLVIIDEMIGHIGQWKYSKI